MRSMQYGKIWPKLNQLIRSQTEKHVVCKEGVPWALANNAHINTVFFIRTGTCIMNKEILVIQISDDLLPQRAVMIRANWHIHSPPVYRFLGKFITHDKAIIR